MSIYKSSSLAMIPTAYKDGKLYSIRPIPEYGAELVTNGDFSGGSTGWTLGTGWTISGGYATHTGSTGNLASNASLSNGTKYKVSFEIVSISGGVCNVYDTSSATTYASFDSVGIKSVTITKDSAGSLAIRSSSTNAVIDNVSIKEVLVEDGDFTFSRGSNLAATRVDVNGLIEKGRENLLLQSNQFDTTWVNELGGSPVITSGQAGYDGTTDAWLVGKGAEQYKRISQSVSASGVWTYSVYAKANTQDSINLRDQTNGKRCEFDLTNGVIIFKQNEIDARMIDLGNGWYRCSVTFNQSTSSLAIYIGWSDSDAGSVYLQDAQLEQGLVATDYIETGTSAAQSGILEDMPRLDYSGSCPSLLLEPQRSNLYTYSEYYDTYTKASCTITSNATRSPEGSQNASKIVSASGGPNIKRIQPSISTTGANEYIISAFAKKAEWDYLFIYGAGTLVNGSLTIFNLDNGTIEQGSGHASIEAFGDDGWYKVTWKATSTGTGTGDPRIGITDNSSGSNSTGDGVSGVYLYGLQIEQGSYPTSYIPTYGTSQTRSLDNVNELTGVSDLIGQSEGTLFLDFVANDDDALQIIYQVRTTGSTNVGQIDFRIQSGLLRALGNDAGTTQFNISAGAAVAGTRYKCAVRYANNDVAFYVNGVLKGSDTNASFSSSALQQISFSENTGTFFPSASIKQALVFPTGLTNTELASLTTL